jgi:hypothetical protein
MPDNCALFHPFPITTIEMHVSAANASCFKLDPHFSPRDFWFCYFFNFDVVRSIVYSSFQKETPSDISSSSREVLSLLYFDLMSLRYVNNSNKLCNDLSAYEFG